MGMGWRRWLLERWRTWEKDPLWEHFIHSAPADPKNNLTIALQSAPEGRIYPVKTEASDPHSMSRQLKELGQWFGAAQVGIATLQPAHLRPASPADAEREVGEKPEDAESGSRQPPFAIVCAIAADYDPSTAQGLGGQLAIRNGAVVNHHLRNYIRELGYRASIGGADPLAVAVAAGLGRLDRRGRFVASMRAGHIHLADPILTDLPLAVDVPGEL